MKPLFAILTVLALAGCATLPDPSPLPQPEPVAVKQAEPSAALAPCDQRCQAERRALIQKMLNLGNDTAFTVAQGH